MAIKNDEILMETIVGQLSQTPDQKQKGQALVSFLLETAPDFVGDIVDFHTKFGLTHDGAPRRLKKELSDFRIKFMREELEEYEQAVEENNLENQFDALVDLVYVAIGTAYLQGFDFDEAWRRVHHANMQKVRALRASDSLRGSTYDVVKPPGWQKPSYEGLLE